MRKDQPAAYSPSLSDVVLPAHQTAQLREIVERSRHSEREQGKTGLIARSSTSVSVLFSGPGGTGKTMAAHALAGELGRPLHRIDLSQLVSKYIGETEKNIARQMAAAERAGAILLFDEADALFGKRTDVRDSHDRYANIEVSYLLQSIEESDGLVIIATRMKENIDPAFIRRLTALVDFPMPGPAERRCIWDRAIPSAIAAEPLDLGKLSGTALSGGEIANVVIDASLRAQHEERPLTMADLERSVSKQMERRGRLYD